MAGSQDNATKQRIIAHMNNDHHDSVIRYLQHFGKVSAFTAYTGRMTDLDLNGLALSCQGKTYRVPFEPPMKSLAEARERTVKIDKDCRKALGHSDVTVKTFEWPQGGGAVAAALTLLTFVGFSQRWWFAPQAIVEQYVGASAAARMWSIQPYLFWILLGVHALESAVLAQTKLKKHSVNPRSTVYWQWIISNTIEGFPCGLRFGRLVKKLEAKQNH